MRDLVNTGWTDEARAASLATRRAKAAERKKAEEAEAEKQANIAKRKAQKAKEEKALARQRMFEWQQKYHGKNFIENWYPRGRDGKGEDPHYGTPTREAPYGYVEGTMTPRKEPLYDRYGRAIVPRPYEDYHPPMEIFPWQKGKSLERDMAWLEELDAARQEWGPFGKKKQWMDKHPNATDADWEEYDQKRFEEWKKQNLRPKRVDSRTGNRNGGHENRLKPTKGNRRVMNTLILNRETFQMPEDGWYQIAPLGEFPHQPTGVVQIVDKEACDAMTNAFSEESGKPNFAGLLIDFDHFSLDDKLKSEAAGWINELQNRDDGLWAKIRWSDVGEECVKGGRYRFLSPVWSQRDCEDLGNGRLRPVRLLNAAVTNDPNLKGMVPLSNRAKGDVIANAAADASDQRYRWELGTSPDDRHCPSCVALAGQVHTKADWDAAGLSPGAGGLYCQGNCYCSLVRTDDPVTGTLGDAPQRTPEAEDGDEAIADRGTDEAVMANVGWTDEARAASIAVRRAKAAARKAAAEKAAEGGDAGGDHPDPDGEDADEGEEDPWADDHLGWFEDEGLSAMSEEAIEALTEQIREKLNKGEALEPAEEGFIQERADKGYAGESDSDPLYEWMERRAMEEADAAREDDEREIEAIHDRADELIAREEDGETLSDEDRDFLDRYREAVGNRGAAVMANVGWTDEARSASLSVRRAKAAARAAGKGFAPGEWPDRRAPGRPPVPWEPPMPPRIPIDDGGMYWPGGSPYFDESTGRYIYPVPQPPMDYPVPPGTPHILPYPFPPQHGDPREWPHPRLPVPPQLPPDAQAVMGWYGDQPSPWTPVSQVAADKARRRAVMQGNG